MDSNSNVNRRENRFVGTAVIEINLYLDHPRINFQEDLISFWKNYKECELRQLALKYLTIPATLVPSKRMGSAGNLTINERRTMLTPEHVNEK